MPCPSRRFSSGVGWLPFGAGQCFNGVLPCPRGDAVVAARQIRFGNLQIQNGLAFGVVLGFDDLFGVVRIGSAQAGAFAGLSVHAVVGSTTDSTADETVTCFHSFHATARITQAESEEVADSGRITPDYSGFLRIGKLVSVLVSVWTPEPPKPLLHTQLELEARVGIEPTNEAFAEPCLTTWLPRRSKNKD